MIEIIAGTRVVADVAVIVVCSVFIYILVKIARSF
jgi:hypothetical protein